MVEFLAFCGKNRVGKTTLADSFSGMVGLSTVISFADPLRDELEAIYGLPASLVRAPSIDKNSILVTFGDYDFTPEAPELWYKHGLISHKEDFASMTVTLREVFVNHATPIRRAEDEGYWLKQFVEKADQMSRDYDIIVVDDTRFDNEFEYLLTKQAKFIEVTNDSNPESDVAQHSATRWLAANQDKLSGHIHAPIPLSRQIADQLNREMIPRLFSNLQSVSGLEISNITRRC